jgi:hypothetical protein
MAVINTQLFLPFLRRGEGRDGKNRRKKTINYYLGHCKQNRIFMVKEIIMSHNEANWNCQTSYLVSYG